MATWRVELHSAETQAYFSITQTSQDQYCGYIFQESSFLQDLYPCPHSCRHGRESNEHLRVLELHSQARLEVLMSSHTMHVFVLVADAHQNNEPCHVPRKTHCRSIGLDLGTRTLISWRALWNICRCTHLPNSIICFKLLYSWRMPVRRSLDTGVAYDFLPVGCEAPRPDNTWVNYFLFGY